jgi:hypothetical protein
MRGRISQQTIGFTDIGERMTNVAGPEIAADGPESGYMREAWSEHGAQMLE